MSSQPPRTKSGEHPIVIGFRRKLESFAGNEADFDRLNEELERMAIATTPPAAVEHTPDSTPTKEVLVPVKEEGKEKSQ